MKGTGRKAEGSYSPTAGVRREGRRETLYNWGVRRGMGIPYKWGVRGAEREE